MGRRTEKLEVSEEDRDLFNSWLRSGSTQQRYADRARAVLLLGEGKSVKEVGRIVGMHFVNVYKWRQRYRLEGVEGLKDRPRSGRPRTMSRAKAEEILHATMHRLPMEATHWSLRLMSKYSGVTVHQVHQLWKFFKLKPHLVKTFKISNDPEFAAKVIDIVELYMNPPKGAVVLSVDEKPQIQALDRTQPMLPLKVGKTECRTHDYKRHGTVDLYAAFDCATGKVMGRLTKRHRAREFIAFLGQIDRSFPPEQEIHLVLDNSSTHKTKEVRDWLKRRKRFKTHFTPTSGSFMNAVESWFATLKRRALQRNGFKGVNALKKEIRRFIEVHNRESAKPFNWKATAESIIEKVEEAKRFDDPVRVSMQN